MIGREDFRAAIGAPDAGFDRALDGAIRQIREREEQSVMKRKMTAALLAAIIALLTLTGAALAVGMNLFDLFGKRDARLSQIAPQAELATEKPGEVETKELGKTAVEILNAYYDGQSLIVAYTEEIARRFEPFTPTDAELAKMEIDPVGVVELFEFGLLDPVQQAYNNALKAGKPYGYVEYSVFAGDQMYAGKHGEIELVPYVEDEIMLEDGRKAYLTEFETQLPEGAQDMDEIELHLPILRFETRTWFDGKDVYILNGPITGEARTYEWFDGETHTSYSSLPEQIGEAVATAKRAGAEIRRYAGEGSCNGVPVRVEATVSAIHGELEITADGDAFPDLAEGRDNAGSDLWYSMELEDENGAALNCERVLWSPGCLLASFTGNGHVPQRLKLRIAVEGESDADARAANVRAEPIELTRAE